MRNKQLGFTVMELLVVIVILVGAYGWVANIVRAVAVIHDSLTMFIVLRFVGIVMFPLGVVLGYIPN